MFVDERIVSQLVQAGERQVRLRRASRVREGLRGGVSGRIGSGMAGRVNEGLRGWLASRVNEGLG